MENSGPVTIAAFGNFLEVVAGQFILDNSSMIVRNSGSMSIFGFGNNIAANSVSLINSSVTLNNESPAVISNGLGWRL
jgi:hypothetical protein